MTNETLARNSALPNRHQRSLGLSYSIVTLWLHFFPRISSISRVRSSVTKFFHLHVQLVRPCLFRGIIPLTSLHHSECRSINISVDCDLRRKPTRHRCFSDAGLPPLLSLRTFLPQALRMFPTPSHFHPKVIPATPALKLTSFQIQSQTW